MRGLAGKVAVIAGGGAVLYTSSGAAYGASPR